MMFGGLPRAEKLRSLGPQLIVDLWIYPTDKSGRQQPIPPVWGSPCTVQSEQGSGWIGFDGWPLLGSTPIEPGERRRVAYVFLSGQKAVEYLRSGGGKFYIWEGRLIGEAMIIDPTISN